MYVFATSTHTLNFYLLAKAVGEKDISKIQFEIHIDLTFPFIVFPSFLG